MTHIQQLALLVYQPRLVVIQLNQYLTYENKGFQYEDNISWR